MDPAEAAYIAAQLRALADRIDPDGPDPDDAEVLYFPSERKLLQFPRRECTA